MDRKGTGRVPGEECQHAISRSQGTPGDAIGLQGGSTPSGSTSRPHGAIFGPSRVMPICTVSNVH